MTARNGDIDCIKQRAARLKKVIPPSVVDLGHKLDYCINVAKYVSLPTKTEHYIKIDGKEEEIENKFKGSNIVVISGAEGMGKSTLAAHYGEKKKSGLVRWMNGKDLHQEFLHLAQALDIATEDVPFEEIREKLYSNLGLLKEVLLIIDNVEDEGKVNSCLGKIPNNTQVIITTRDRNLFVSSSHVQLKGFSKKEAEAYLTEALQQQNLNEKAIKNLQRLIGESPLNLSKAVAYLNKPFSNLIDHEKALEKSLQFPKHVKDIKACIENIVEALLHAGMEYMIDEQMSKKQLGIISLEKALAMHFKFDFGNKARSAEILRMVALGYEVLEYTSKALDYHMQSYAILSTALGSDHERLKVYQNDIEKLQSWMARSYFKGNERENKNCLGGHVGTECRYPIINRGVIDENLLKIVQKWNENWTASDQWSRFFWGSLKWSNIGIITGKEHGLKGYLEKEYLKEKLKELGNDENIELAQMLLFEAVSTVIMLSEEKNYSILKRFTREKPELVKKIATQHPEYFVDGTIVEACLQAMSHDRAFMNHIFENVKYMGMEELRKKTIKSNK